MPRKGSGPCVANLTTQAATQPQLEGPLKSRLKSPRHLASAALLAAALTACSSAPLPEAVSGPDGGGAGGPASSAPNVDPVTGQPAATTPGGKPAPGGTGGSTSGGTTTGTGGTTSGGTTGSPGSTGGATGSTGGSTAGGTTGTPGDPPGTVSRLFTPSEDRIGITPTSITMCAHAALTYGAAFNTSADDFNVFWTDLNSKGGINGRKVNVTYENDNYTGPDAKTAATACHAKNPFILLGGIGFDQIPTVRNYVETVHQLYLHHTATIEGTKGQKYSFSELPTVERTGESYAQLAHLKFQGKRIGIIERDSPNWSPGIKAFKAKAKEYGLNIVKEVKVQDKQGNYTNEVLAMKNAKVDVIFSWENALNTTELVKQGKAQVYRGAWMVFGVNLMAQTLGNDALNPPLVGSVMYTPYSKGDYSGNFAPYASDMKQFEAQYAKYRPNTDLSGVGGDLLFLNWTAQKALAAQLAACGKDCTRNRFVDVLHGYHARPTSSVCDIDFTHSDGYHGSTQLNFIQAYKAPSGKVNFSMLKSCVDR
jgi:ABC-type branched-subunit amino acid transport system substrate-binding protein